MTLRADQWNFTLYSSEDFKNISTLQALVIGIKLKWTCRKVFLHKKKIYGAQDFKAVEGFNAWMTASAVTSRSSGGIQCSANLKTVVDLSQKIKPDCGLLDAISWFVMINRNEVHVFEFDGN